MRPFPHQPVKRRRPIPKKPQRYAERSLKAFKIQQIINLSEDKLIKVLEGKTKLDEKTVVNVALELYKRRVPTKVEGDKTGDKLTVIKVIKNHVPTKVVDTIDITTDNIEKAADAVLERAGIEKD